MPSSLLVAGLDVRSLLLEAPVLQRERHVVQGRTYARDLLREIGPVGARLVVLGTDLPDLSLANQIGFILEVESAASFDELTRSGDVDQLASGTSRSTWPNTFKAGRFVPAVEYIRAQRIRTILMRQSLVNHSF